MTQTYGRRTALTFAVALRPGGARFLKTFLALAGHVRQVTQPLRRFEVIQFARWSVIEQFPGQPAGMPPRPLLLFQSNFDDDLADYLDTFAVLLPRRFRAVWFTSSGYPGLIPTDGFRRWVNSMEATPGHYWSAYSSASISMIDAALRVNEATKDLAKQAATMTSKQFAAAYAQMLIEVQTWL